MMGHSHALSGALVWLAAAPGLAALTPVAEHATVPAELLAGALVCAGAAMLPDLDHPKATIAQTFGPVTWVLSKAVNALAGGHRQATHSLLFCLAAGVGAHLLAEWDIVARDVVVVLMIGLALRALAVGVPGRTLTSAVVNVLLTTALFLIFHSFGVGYGWLGLAVAIGALVHVVGDCLTERGCPVLWPIKGRWLLPYKIGFKTGKWFEQRFLAPALSVGIVVLLYLRLMPQVTVG